MTCTLIAAIQNGEESLAKQIIRDGTYGISDNQTAWIADKALLFSCSRGFLELAELLLDKDANVATTDKNLATPLHGAVDNGHLDLVRLLINRGAEVNAQNNRGDTPLHLAAYRGYMEITRCLVNSGADCGLVNTKSFTAENEAVVQGHTHVVSYLRSTQNVWSSLTGERNDRFLDSMIQLDAPPATSIPDLPSSPSATEKPEITQRQPISKLQKHNSSFRIQNWESELSSKPDSIDIQVNKLRNLSWISQDPPKDCYPSKYVTHCHMTFDAKKCDGFSKPPTFCSAFNCNNDFTAVTHTEALCLNSNRCNVPDNVWNCRRKDVDIQGVRLVNRSEDTQEEDFLLLSLGVRNPPVRKQFPQLSASTRETCFSDFSDMYDSTLFSLRSIKYGSLIPTQRRTITENFDYATSDKRQHT